MNRQEFVNAKRIVIGTSVFNTDLLEKITSNRLILAFDIDDKFIVGFGLDYKGIYRNLDYIGYFE